MRHHGRGITGAMVADAVRDFQREKKAAGRSAAYLRDIAYRLGGFAKAFNVEVRQLPPQDVADYLGKLKLQPRGFNNQVLMLRTFFGFCQARGWLSRDVDLLAVVERRSGTASEIEIFTPAELRKVLGKASPRVAACIAIQAFAGVRTAELFRLTWQDIERRRDHIEIGAGKAKTASRRLIPISDNRCGMAKRGSPTGIRTCVAGDAERVLRTTGHSEQGCRRYMESKRASAFLHKLPRCANERYRRRCARSGQFADDDLPPLPGVGHRRGIGAVVRHSAIDW
jgi:integrase